MPSPNESASIGVQVLERRCVKWNGNPPGYEGEPDRKVPAEIIIGLGDLPARSYRPTLELSQEEAETWQPDDNIPVAVSRQ